MLRKKIITSTLVWGTLALALNFTGCSQKTSDSNQSQLAERIIIPVQAAVAKERNLQHVIDFSGTADAIRRAGLAPAIPGSRVMQIHVEEGQRVTEGQLLVTMEDFQLQQTSAQLRQLEADYNRMATLFKRGSVTAQQYDQIKASLAAAKAAYQLQEKSVELRAPFAGRVIGRHIQAGEIFNGMATDGTPAVVSIGQLSRMKVEIMVPEREFALLRQGQTAHIRADAYPDTLFSGLITTINPALHRVTRSARVVIELNNPAMLLKPGMFTRVQILVREIPQVLAVPNSAIVMRNNSPHVFTVPAQSPPFNTQPELVKVTTGASFGGYTQILEGIQTGTLVITSNNTSLTPQTEVNVESIVGDDK